jgi:hypothetical protein
MFVGFGVGTLRGNVASAIDVHNVDDAGSTSRHIEGRKVALHKGTDHATRPGQRRTSYFRHDKVLFLTWGIWELACGGMIGIPAWDLD